MAIRISPYSDEHVSAVIDFNGRLRAGGAPREFQFSESPIPRWLPKTDGASVYNEFYLALDGDVVRGTCVLKHQPFSFSGEVRPIVYYHHPFSEGIVNKAYTTVGLQVLLHAVRMYPMTYALGMGGYDRPLPRILVAMGWPHCLVPFFFKVLRPARFLHNMQVLRRTRAKRMVADLAIFSGTGWLTLKGLHFLKSLPSHRRGISFEVVEQFCDFADNIWRECGAAYAMIAVRDSQTLCSLYPAANPHFTRIKVSREGQVIGWAVTAVSRKENDPQYGNLCVGVIVDCLALPRNAAYVIDAAARVLASIGVDLITSNQCHAAWARALARAGFLKGPSNFIFAASKDLGGILQPFDQVVSSVHLNRSDGDGLFQYV